MPYHGMASGTVRLVGFIIAFYFSLAAIDNYSSCTSYIICTAALKGKIEGPIVRNLLQTSNKGTPLPSFFFISYFTSYDDIFFLGIFTSTKEVVFYVALL